MANKSKRNKAVNSANPRKTLLTWAVGIFLLKLIIIGNLEGGAWLGADGENYISGFDSLITNGIFSEDSKLTYWPAGYPLFILLLSILGKSFVFTTLSIVQSAIFSFAACFFALQLIRTRLKPYANLIFLLIILNPTLSLSSYVVGYESLAASGYLIAVSIIMKSFIDTSRKPLIYYVSLTSLVFSAISFVQPRFLLSALLISALWIFIKSPWKTGSLLILFSVIITLFLPATLVYRNIKAVDLISISTNLGGTMSIGSGDQADGSYNPSFSGPPCILAGSESQMDNQRVICALDWYLSNPIKSAKLFFNKSKYFWSPWVGPLENGTMARNPSLPIHPIDSIRKTPDGHKLVYGSLGKLISWAWMLTGIGFLFFGFTVLWKMKSLERFIGSVAAIAVCSSWLISLLTIGDHRFRLPIMGMSLFLQAVGIRTLFKGGKPPMVDGPGLR